MSLATGINCFAVRDDLLRRLTDPLPADAAVNLLSAARMYRPPRYGQPGVGHPADPLRRLWVDPAAALSSIKEDEGPATLSSKDLMYKGRRSPMLRSSSKQLKHTNVSSPSGI